MARHRAWLISVSFLAISFVVPGTGQELKPPAAAVQPKDTKVHGVTLHDDYSWLREKSNPQVIKRGGSEIHESGSTSTSAVRSTRRRSS